MSGTWESVLYTSAYRQGRPPLPYFPPQIQHPQLQTSSATKRNKALFRHKKENRDPGGRIPGTAIAAADWQTPFPVSWGFGWAQGLQDAINLRDRDNPIYTKDYEVTSIAFDPPAQLNFTTSLSCCLLLSVPPLLLRTASLHKGRLSTSFVLRGVLLGSSRRR